MTEQKFEKLGGWLRFFLVVNWLQLILCLGTALLFLVSLFESESATHFFSMFIYIPECIVSAVLLYKILRLIYIRDAAIPNRIVRLITWLTVLGILFIIPEMILEYAWAKELDYSEWGQIAVRTLIYCFIWRGYFMKSQRVSVYYGQNATEDRK